MRFTIVALLLLSLVAPAWAAETDEFVGSVEVGYREADVDGNEDKYREDINLADDAVRLFALDLDYRPADRAWIDSARLEARGLGGEPSSSARFGMGKTGRYDLDLGYRVSDFFRRDAGYFFRDGGDLHSWDTRRRVFDLGLRVDVSDRVKLRFGADRVEREGGLRTSRDLQSDEFILDTPADQSASTYWAAADLRFAWVDVTVEQRFASYENRWQLSAMSTDGEEPGGAFVDDYSQVRHEDASAPVSRIWVHGRPLDRIEFSVGYARVNADLDYDVNGSWSGLDFDEQPVGNPPEAYQTTLTNAGRIERTTDLVDLDFSVRLVDGLDLNLDYSQRAYDQDGRIDSEEVQTGGKEDGSYFVQGDLHNELQLDTYGFTLDWQADASFGVAVGAGWQQRSKLFQLSGPELETERTVYRVGVRWRPLKMWKLRLDLEQGDDDDPLTPVSVTSVDRVRLRSEIRPVERLGLLLTYLDETKENDLTTVLGLPTDDTPPADTISLARFEVTSWSLVATWNGTTIDASVGYSDFDVDSDAHIVYVTGSTFFPTFDVFTTRGRTAYVADQGVAHGRLRCRLSDVWSIGARAILVDNEGSLPLDSTTLGADVLYEHGQGLFFRVALDAYDYDEDNPFAGDPALPTPDVNDYDAKLWTVALGYRF